MAMKKTAVTLAFGLAVLLITAASTGSLRPASVLAEPQITEANPQFGDTIETLPEFLHLCFTEPVKVDESTDWKFDVKTPEGKALGLRIVFKPAGDCVDVFPGAPTEPPNGIWTFDWLVHAQSDGSEGSGAIKFQLGELRPGETPLEKPDVPESQSDSGDDGGVPIALLAVIGAGAALIIVAGAGFGLSRRRG